MALKSLKRHQPRLTNQLTNRRTCLTNCWEKSKRKSKRNRRRETRRREQPLPSWPKKQESLTRKWKADSSSKRKKRKRLRRKPNWKRKGRKGKLLRKKRKRERSEGDSCFRGRGKRKRNKGGLNRKSAKERWKKREDTGKSNRQEGRCTGRTTRNSITTLMEGLSRVDLRDSKLKTSHSLKELQNRVWRKSTLSKEIMSMIRNKSKSRPFLSKMKLISIDLKHKLTIMTLNLSSLQSPKNLSSRTLMKMAQLSFMDLEITCSRTSCLLIKLGEECRKRWSKKKLKEMLKSKDKLKFWRKEKRRKKLRRKLSLMHWKSKDKRRERKRRKKRKLKRKSKKPNQLQRRRNRRKKNQRRVMTKLQLSRFIRSRKRSQLLLNKLPNHNQLLLRKNPQLKMLKPLNLKRQHHRRRKIRRKKLSKFTNQSNPRLSQ